MEVYSGSTAKVQLLMPFGILLGILYLLIALALQARMQSKAPNLMRLLVIAASIAAAMRLCGTMLSVRGIAAMLKAPDLSIYGPFLVVQSGLNTAAENAWNWARS